MGKESSDNIFGLAGGAGKAKPNPAPKAPPIPQSTTSIDFEALKTAYEAVKEMRDELDRNIETVYMRTGLTKETITRMLDNPTTYKAPDVDADDLQIRRQSLKKEVEKMVGEEAFEEMESKARSKELDKRKRKTMGARRNWLNMR